jgi:hypothetical protein
MLQELQYSGEWWSPTSPENKIHGSLIFNQDKGARLTLDARLDSEPTIINGLASDNTKITLDGCIQNISELAAILKIPSEFYAHQVYVGTHFTKHEDIKFSFLYCHFANLNEWIMKNGFSFEKDTFTDLTIRYQNPSNISISINPELNLLIDFWCPYSLKKHSEINLKQVARIQFRPTQSKTIDYYSVLVKHFRNFLCFATQETVFTKELSGFISDESPKTEIKIFYQLDSPVDIDIDAYNSLFNFKDIENKFENCLQNWFNKYADIEPVCQLYFGSLYGRFVYLNLKFLSLVQAVEAYHRRFLLNEELLPEEHAKRITSILSKAPTEHLEWLKTKLKYSNEPSLRRRLSSIFKKFAPLTNIIPNEDFFINKVVATRNYMTHYDLALKTERAADKELVLITEELRAIVEMCLLNELGFTLEETRNLITRFYEQKIKYYQSLLN